MNKSTPESTAHFASARFSLHSPAGSESGCGRNTAQQELDIRLEQLQKQGAQYLESLSTEDLQDLHASIGIVLDEVHCTSTHQDTRNTIQKIAQLLNFDQGRLFYRAQPEGITLESCAYHIELGRCLKELDSLLRHRQANLVEAAILRDRILQIMGITMDQIFLLFNKTELEYFIQHNNAPEEYPEGTTDELAKTMRAYAEERKDLFPFFSDSEVRRFEAARHPNSANMSQVGLFSSMVSRDLQEFQKKLEIIGMPMNGDPMETREFRSILRRLARQHHALLWLKSDIYNNGEVNSQESIDRVRDAISMLEPIDLIRIYQSIHGARTGTSYTSNSTEARSRITFFAELLGTRDGKILYESHPEGVGAERFEYHCFLVGVIENLHAELALGNDSIIRLETLKQRAFNVIGLAMDSTFLIFNKPELEPLITCVVEDLAHFYERLSEMGNPHVGDSETLAAFRANLKRAAEHYRAVLVLNYITYHPGDAESGTKLLAEAVSKIDAHYKDPTYYYAIAEANLELFLAKRSTDDTREQDIATLHARLAKLTHGVDSTVSLLNSTVPSEMNGFTDDMFEVLTALVRMETQMSTDELIDSISKFIRESRHTLIHQNERAYGFFLQLIESMFESLLYSERRLPSDSTTAMIKLVREYLNETSRGNTMLEEYSRIHLRIASVYGKIYADQLREASIENSPAKDPDFDLIIRGKEAFLAGIYTYNIQDSESVKLHGKYYLDALIRAYNYTHGKLRPEIVSDDYVEQGYKKMTECWLEEQSYLQIHAEREWKSNVAQLDGLREKLDVQSIHDFERYTREICRITTEYLHGFFNVFIVPYGNRPPARGDIDTQSHDIGFGFEMIFESYSLKSETRNTFVTNEFPAIIAKVRDMMKTTLDSFCPSSSKNSFSNFSTLPPDSSASYAKWYKRLILDTPEIMVYLQEKAKFTSPPVTDTDDLFGGREIVLQSSGVECLLRLKDRFTGKIFWPGPATPEEIRDAKGKTIELWLFQALDVFGEYFGFMQRQLKEIMLEMRETKFDFSINVRGDELEDPKYFQGLESLIFDTAKTRMQGNRQKSYKVNPTRIKIELLETHMETRNAQVISNLRNFQAIGGRISLDDYWTSDSGEARIRALSEEGIIINEIKLDGSYIPRLEAEYRDTGKLERAQADIQRIRDLTNPETVIVLEKVETKFQAQLAQMAGIDEIQGYFHSKPDLSSTYCLDRAQKETRREVTYTISSIR